VGNLQWPKALSVVWEKARWITQPLSIQSTCLQPAVGPFPSSGVSQPFEQLLEVEEANDDVDQCLAQSDAA